MKNEWLSITLGVLGLIIFCITSPIWIVPYIILSKINNKREV
jgi:hypothetical protein